MIRSVVSVLLVTLLLGAFLPGNAGRMTDVGVDTAAFTLVKSSRGIALYERWYPIDHNLNAREVKATFTLKAQTDAVLALLKDASRGGMWNKNTNAYEVVDVGSESWVCYIQYDLPWPVNNQDCVLQYNTSGDADSVVVTFQTIDHSGFPERKRIERIPHIKGKWILKKVDDQIQVEYYITTKPSKSLPNWLTDPIIRNNLIETVGAFRSMLENEV